MNKWNTLLAALLFAVPVFAQEEVETGSEEGSEPAVFEEEGSGEPDTTRMNVGGREIIIITKNDGESEELNLEFDEEPEEERKNKSEAHWAGVDFGVSMLMNENFQNSFPNNPYWENDAARSHVWNLNIMEHKFNFGTPYVGLTTGLGFSFTSVAFKNSFLLQSDADTVFAVADTINTYTKNKLKATYLTVPLMLEFNTSADSDRSFYLAAGVVGGVRLTQRLKRNGEFQGTEFEERIKGDYNLNSFKLDAAARLGYGDWGVFANYSLLPLFNEGKTTEVYPLTFGLSYNF